MTKELDNQKPRGEGWEAKKVRMRDHQERKHRLRAKKKLQAKELQFEKLRVRMRGHWKENERSFKDEIERTKSEVVKAKGERMEVMDWRG